MTSPEEVGSPRKRMKFSPEAQMSKKPMSIDSLTAVPHDTAAGLATEVVVGITSYVSSETPGFQGVLKKRYTDFLVNEILPDGRVLHLRNLGGPSARQKKEESQLGFSNGASSNALDTNKDAAPEGATTTQERPNHGKAVAEAARSHSGEEETPQVSVDDITKLISYIGEKAAEQLLALYDKVLANPAAKSRDHGSVSAAIPAEKSLRTALHQDIRRIFNSQIESSTDTGKKLLIFSASLPQIRTPNNERNRHGPERRQGKLGWKECGGEYLHFSLYKENKDTMEVISYLTKQLRTNARNFQFAGTKDRRAVTVQRVSAFRLQENGLAYQNKLLRNSSVGDFEYQKNGLELGDLKGNEFVITLRECDWEAGKGLSAQDRLAVAEQALGPACRDLHDKGFFNYYGLQRFGTFTVRTDIVGVKLLQGDFNGACLAILDYSPDVLTAAHNPSGTDRISSDDKARAEAISLFLEQGTVGEALEKLPRKFSAEANIIRHLGRTRTDFAGAIQMIPRNLRLMYVHAYQSLVWNHAVNERWRLFGDRVVEGDLVLVNEHKDKVSHEATATAEEVEEIDADGEIIVQPEGEDRSQALDDAFERARVLTAKEASSGQYSIFDIVLPLPGFDVLYPGNAMTEFYKEFMDSERGGRLDPFDMRRKQKDFSLSGSYRKMLARVLKPGCEFLVRLYDDDNEQFVDTDLDLLNKKKKSSASASASTNPEPDRNPVSLSLSAQGDDTSRTKEKGGEKLAVVLKLQLGASQYATMVLRELSKSGVSAYKPDFGGGR